MFDISIWEIGVVLLVALVVLGPQQMLRISYKLGRWLRYFRHSFAAVSNEINQHLNVEMLEKPIESLESTHAGKDVPAAVKKSEPSHD